MTTMPAAARLIVESVFQDKQWFAISLTDCSWHGGGCIVRPGQSDLWITSWILNEVWCHKSENKKLVVCFIDAVEPYCMQVRDIEREVINGRMLSMAAVSQWKGWS